MSPWLLGAAALLVGGLGPAVLLTMRGDPVRRLLGLQLAGPVTVLVLLLLAQGLGQSTYLIVPLCLALVGFTGTLVFTRLMRPTE